MSKETVVVSPEAARKDSEFVAERRSKGTERYIKRHSLQARLTHGITVSACILLAISGLFVFVPALAQAVGPDVVFAIRMSHRVIGVIFVVVPPHQRHQIAPGGAPCLRQSVREMELRRQEMDDPVFAVPLLG